MFDDDEQKSSQKLPTICNADKAPLIFCKKFVKNSDGIGSFTELKNLHLQ